MIVSTSVDCAFCQRVFASDGDSSYPGVLIFEPLNPVIPGHMLVIPRIHVRDAVARPQITAYTFRQAAVYADRYHSLNMITSVGEQATQTIEHFHIHLVPRWYGDGLKLPWSPE